MCSYSYILETRAFITYLSKFGFLLICEKHYFKARFSLPPFHKNKNHTCYNRNIYNTSFKIFPNPANNHITIDYGNFATMNGYQLKIENSLGQQLFQTNITQQTDYLSLNNWGGNGLYFVHIIDAQGNTIDIRKIVLQ